MRAVLFDIDGTLMKAGGAGRKGLALAAEQVLSRSGKAAHQAIKDIDFRGATDAGILAQYASALGIGDNLMAHGAFIDSYLGHLRRLVADTAIQRIEGALSLARHLMNEPGVSVGVLTGNIRAAAQVKLAAIGMDGLMLAPGGFGDDGIARSDLVGTALKRLAPLTVKASQTLIIGDPPRDVQAAHVHGVACVAVATGWTDLADLQKSGAELVLANLDDMAPVLNLLDALPT